MDSERIPKRKSFDPIEFLLWTDMTYRLMKINEEDPKYTFSLKDDPFLKEYGELTAENLGDILFSVLSLDKRFDHADVRYRYESYMRKLSGVRCILPSAQDQEFSKLADEVLRFLQKESNRTDLPRN